MDELENQLGNNLECEAQNQVDIPILVSLPSQHKRTYADVLFTLNHWMRVSVSSDFNDYYSHKLKKFSYWSAFKSIWTPIKVYLKKGGWKPVFLFHLLKDSVFNLFFSFKLLLSFLFSFKRRKSIQEITNKEKAFLYIMEEYNDFSKREAWYNFDFWSRLNAYLKIDEKNEGFVSNINQFTSISYLLLKVVLAYPLNAIRNKLGNVDDFYMVLEIDGEGTNKGLDSFGDCRYVGFKSKSTYVQALKYRDLSAYLLKIEKPAKLISIADMDTVLVGCIAPDNFPVEEYLLGKALMCSNLKDGRKRYIFEIKTLRARTFLKKISNTPIELEGFLSF